MNFWSGANSRIFCNIFVNVGSFKCFLKNESTDYNFKKLVKTTNTHKHKEKHVSMSSHSWSNHFRLNCEHACIYGGATSPHIHIKAQICYLANLLKQHIHSLAEFALPILYTCAGCWILQQVTVYVWWDMRTLCIC